MSITCIEMVTDALRLVNVLDMNQVPSAEQGESARRSLNEMMADWEVDGIRLGWLPANVMGDTLTLAEENIRGVKYCFACELAGGYGLEPPQVVQVIARNAYARLAKVALQFFECSMDQLPLAEPFGTNAWPNG